MTDLAPAPAAVDALAVGEAVAAARLALPGRRVQAQAGAPTLPEDEPTAVAVDLAGGGRVVLVAAKGAARQLQVGPPPADDLVEACTEPLSVAAQVVGIAAAGAPRVVSADEAAADDGMVAVAAGLLDAGDAHVATVVVLLPAPAEVAPSAPVHEFAPIADGASLTLAGTGLELLHEVALGVTAELGRTEMLVREVLSLAPGSVIELDRAAGSPVDVLVNGTLIARGEVVVIDEEFGIRITEVVGYDEARG